MGIAVAEAPPPQVEIVVVNPPRLAPLGGEAAFASRQLDASDLKVSPRLDDALKQIPGVSLFRRTGSEGANPTIQGISLRAIAPSGAGRALVTLDGVPQNDPFGGWVIWSALPPEGLDGATVVRGAGSGPYGAGALTGVIALRERGSADGLQALDVSAGSRDSGRIAASGGARGLLVTASAQTTDGYVPVRGAVAGAADRPAHLRSASLAARIDGHIGAARTALRIDGYREDRGAGLDKADSLASGVSAAFTAAQSAEQGAGGWRLQAWVRASDLENSSVAVGAGRTATTPANDQYSTPALGYGANAAWQGRAGDWSWEAGVDARAAEGADFERFRVLNGIFTRGREAGGKSRVAGIYAEAALDRGPLILTGGVRADRWKTYGAVRKERDLATNAVLLNNPPVGSSGTTPTGRLGVRYSVSDALWLRAAAYAGFRPPSLNELHRPFRVGNDVTEANPRLKPETLQGLEAGLGGGAGADWSLTAFYNRLKDPITNVTVGFGPATFPTAGLIPAGGVLRQRQNVGEIEAYGIEGDASAEVGAALTLRAAVQATRARVDGGAAAPQLTGKRPAQTPKLTATAGADWRAAPRLRLSAAVRYESARFEDDLNLRVLAAGAGLDLRAAWSLGEGRELYLAADNVVGSRLEVGETADGVESYAAPRTIRAGFSFRR